MAEDYLILKAQQERFVNDDFRKIWNIEELGEEGGEIDRKPRD
jgi:hypothetical protein